MIKKPLAIMAIVVLCASAIAWKTTNKNSENETGAGAPKKKVAYYAPWDYVMDWRYGRTCDPGGGICFKNEYGDVFKYWVLDASMGDVIPGYIVAPNDVPGDDGVNPEVGPMYMRVEGAKLHVIFCRSVEGNTFDVDDPIRFRDEILNSLGHRFKLKTGRYNVDYTTYKDFGEAWIDIQHD